MSVDNKKLLKLLLENVKGLSPDICFEKDNSFCIRFEGYEYNTVEAYNEVSLWICTPVMDLPGLDGIAVTGLNGDVKRLTCDECYKWASFYRLRNGTNRLIHNGNMYDDAPIEKLYEMLERCIELNRQIPALAAKVAFNRALGRDRVERLV